MTEAEIRRFVACLNTAKASEQDAAWDQLRPLGEAVVPFLAEAFPGMRKWQGRVALVFHAIRYAQTSEAAFRLGVLACQDDGLTYGRVALQGRRDLSQFDAVPTDLYLMIQATEELDLAVGHIHEDLQPALVSII